MPRRRLSKESDNSVALRVGAGAAGLLAGLVFGFFAAVLIARGTGHVSPYVVFGCALLGLVVGVLLVDVGLHMFEGSVHFLIGFLHGLMERFPRIDKLTPGWVAMALLVGVAFGFAWVGFFLRR